MATAREPFEWTFSGVELDAEFLVLLMAFGSDDPDEGTTIRFSNEIDARMARRFACIGSAAAAPS